MGKHQSQKGDESLHPELQDFVDEIGLVAGRVRIVVHEGKVDTISVKPNFRFKFDEEGGTIRLSQINELSLNSSISNVRTWLVDQVLDYIAPFGQIKIKVADSHVCEWRFTRKCRKAKKKSKENELAEGKYPRRLRK